MIHSSVSGLQTKFWSVCAAILVMMHLAAPNARAAATLRTDHGTYVTGQSIGVTFFNGPGNPKDWIGIYAADVVPGTSGSIGFKYTDDGSGTTPRPTGAVSFALNLAPGSYVAYLLENDGYRVLAKDAFDVVSTTVPLVQADKGVYGKGEKITINFNRGPGNVKDWIGIYPEGVEPGAGSTDYRYVDNTTAGNVAVTDGAVTFNNGLAAPGKWVAYLLVDDSNTPVAKDSFEVLLSGTTVKLQPDQEKYLPGQPIKIAFDGGPGNPKDWIGLYKAGQIPGPTPSTVWNYVGGTQTPGDGITTGVIEFPDGLTGPQLWRAFFMVDDGYTIVGDATVEVVDASAPIVQTSKRVYNVGEGISIDFHNAPGNAKDWIGIYKTGVNPAKATATLWNYTDGTHTGAAGIAEGALTFAGLSSEENWTAYLFADDGYTVLAQEDFTVKQTGVAAARVLSILPAEGSTSPASPSMTAVLENRDTTVNTSTLTVKLDGTAIAHTETLDGSKITVSAQATAIYAQGSAHTFEISFKDSAGTDVTATTHFTIQPVVSITLPTPLFFENFDSTPEGSVPTGWTVQNDSDNQDIPADLGDLGSLAYANFTVVDAAGLGGDFLTYSGTPEVKPIAQILGSGSASYVVNGSLVKTFANGRVLIAVSGYHGGNNQVLEARTPTYNLTGKSDIYISFHSLLEQNQDSIEGIEVSNDGGASWAPVVYYLDPRDIVTTGDPAADVTAIYGTDHTDVAHFSDGSGGNYGAFLKAPLDAAVAAATQPRLDDDPADGTRVELIRVPAADNKASVQFRIFYAGTDSWYWGVDDFGIYSIAAGVTASLTATLSNGAVTISWPDGLTAAGGYVLQSSATLAPNSWTNVTPVSGNSYTPTAGAPAAFYRLFKQ